MLLQLRVANTHTWSFSMIWPAIPVLSCSLISYLVHVPTILPASYHSLELSQYKNVECAIVQSILVWISCKHVGQHSYLKRKYFDNKITLDHPGWPSLEKQISPDSREHYCITTTWLDFKLYLTGKMFDLNNMKVNLSNTYSSLWIHLNNLTNQSKLGHHTI